MYIGIYVLHVCMVAYFVQQSIDQPVANLLVVSRTRKMNISLSPLAPEKIWSRETGLAVLSRISLIILHTQAESGACYPSHPRPRLCRALSSNLPDMICLGNVWLPDA